MLVPQEIDYSCHLKEKKKRKRSSPNKGKNHIIILWNKLITIHISLFFFTRLIDYDIKKGIPDTKN